LYVGAIARGIAIIGAEEEQDILLHQTERSKKVGAREGALEREASWWHPELDRIERGTLRREQQ
jgi:hypothetical protein